MVPRVCALIVACAAATPGYAQYYTWGYGSRPTVSYYSYYPTSTYVVPTTYSVPVTTVTPYYSPTTAYYAPAPTCYAPVVTTAWCDSYSTCTSYSVGYESTCVTEYRPVCQTSYPGAVSTVSSVPTHAATPPPRPRRMFQTVPGVDSP